MHSVAEKIAWRAGLLELKLRGAIPYVGWPRLLGAMQPAPASSDDVQLLHALLQVPIRSKGRVEDSSLVLWETPLGDFWGRAGEAPLLAYHVKEQLDGVYQREPVVVRAEDVVFDAGANVGVFARVAFQRGARLVVAFEPEPTNVCCLQRTFRRESEQGRFILVEAALWESSGAKPFHLHGSSGASGSLLNRAGGAGVIQVPVTTLDETVERLKLDRVDFIKMDIEGAERHALRGGFQTLSRFGPRMALCIYHRADDPEAVPRLALEARPQYRVFTTPTQAYLH